MLSYIYIHLKIINDTFKTHTVLQNSSNINTSNIRERQRETDKQTETDRQSKVNAGKRTGLQIVFHSVPGTDCITVHAVDLTSKVFIMR